MRFLAPVAAAALLIAGCKADAPQAPEAKPGVSIENARLVLPAVAGNPGVAYFSLRNGGEAATALAAVSIEGAEKVELHQTSDGKMSAVTSVEIKPGSAIAFAPGGRHAMVFGIGPKLAAPSTAEITLTFADGDKVSAPLKVEPFGSVAYDLSQPDPEGAE